MSSVLFITAGRIRTTKQWSIHWAPLELSSLPTKHRAGVAQIVLPIWYDTFDFATRVEYLGIGLWGSHRACAKSYFVYAGELSEALLTIMDLNNVKGQIMVERRGSWQRLPTHMEGVKPPPRRSWNLQKQTV